MATAKALMVLEHSGVISQQMVKPLALTSDMENTQQDFKEDNGPMRPVLLHPLMDSIMEIMDSIMEMDSITEIMDLITEIMDSIMEIMVSIMEMDSIMEIMETLDQTLEAMDSALVVTMETANSTMASTLDLTLVAMAIIPVAVAITLVAMAITPVAMAITPVAMTITLAAMAIIPVAVAITLAAVDIIVAAMDSIVDSTLEWMTDTVAALHLPSTPMEVLEILATVATPSDPSSVEETLTQGIMEAKLPPTQGLLAQTAAALTLDPDRVSGSSQLHIGISSLCTS